MLFSDVYNEVVNYRFNGANVPSAKLWVNTRYGMAWNDSPWTFAQGLANVSVTANSNTLGSLPTDFGRVNAIFRDDGTQLVYVTPQDYEKTFYAGTSTQTGVPGFYTVIGGTIYVGPTSSVTSSIYQLSYLKKWTKLVNDADVPLLPEEYHYMLVHGALATGLAVVNDFTWEFQEQLYQQMLVSMRDSYQSDYGGTLQFVRDNSGMEPPRF